MSKIINKIYRMLINSIIYSSTIVYMFFIIPNLLI